ncbi:LOW QUALITY PROTEIN: hypothetical protein ACHAXT_008892 [Thalassiosira profunda]
MFRKRRPSSSSSAASSGAPSGLSLLGRRRSASSHDGPSSNGGCSAHPSALPALIQRLIILHDGLMPVPATLAHQMQQRRRHPELSEDASLDEHGEFILYYYDHSLHFEGRQTPESIRNGNDCNASASAPTDGDAPLPADHATEEAVRFAGLCRALRSLPFALQSDDEDHSSLDEGTKSETEVVHMKESTLVFVPLELGGDIVAIAQIPRADNTQKGTKRASAGFGADPAAMKEAVRRIHTAFSLLRGGGIHRRLLHTRHLEGSEEWVLEVFENEDREECSVTSSSLDGKNKLNRSNPLSGKDDAVWEATGDKQPEEPRGNSRESRSLKKKLSASCSRHEDSEYRYGGMEELFALRRERRKLSNKLKDDHTAPRSGGLEGSANGWGSKQSAEALPNDIADNLCQSDCERRIAQLLKVLPITQLRKDLVEFYDDRLCRLQGVCEVMRGGTGRCLVEMVPPPLGHSTIEPVRGQHPPLAPKAFVCLAASEFMKAMMLVQYGPKANGYGRLFGMSLFYEGRLVLSKVSPSKNSQDEQVGLPPEIPNTIVDHFNSYQMSEEEKATPSDEDTTTQNGTDAPFVRWMSNLSVARNEGTPEAPKQLSSDVSNANTTNDPSLGYFMSPASEDSDDLLELLYVKQLRRQVWLPRIHFPHSLEFNSPGEDEPAIHVALFRGGELSFLLFFELPNAKGSDDALAQMVRELQPRPSAGTRTTARSKRHSKSVSKTTQAFADMLASLSGELTEFCETYSSREADPNSEATAPRREINSDALFPGERGMDIVCIDRANESFILLSQHDLAAEEIKRVTPNTDGVPNGLKPLLDLFGGVSKLKGETINGEPSVRPSKYKSMLDCRHKLAAYLPLDVLLAFDDMFGEIGRKRRREEAIKSDLDEAGLDSSGSGTIELCTFLPEGWVYGRACRSLELYILLDTSTFVTINDVQKAVMRVRERLLNDKLR